MFKLSKPLVLLISLVFLVVLVSAEPLIFEKGSETNLQIPCQFNGTNCDSSAVCNASVIYPNQSIMINNELLTNTGNGLVNLTITDTNTLGVYNVNVVCTESGISGGSTFPYEITVTGKDLSGAKSSTYILIFVISLLIFLGLLALGLFLPSENSRDEMTGYILYVSNLKYLKFTLIGLSYITLVWISYFSWMMSYAYLDMDYISTILQFLFYFLAILTLPLFILYTYISITNLIRDSQVSDLLLRGIKTK